MSKKYKTTYTLVVEGYEVIAGNMNLEERMADEVIGTFGECLQISLKDKSKITILKEGKEMKRIR